MFAVLAVTFGMTSPTMYYYTKVMSELFLDTQFPETKNTFRGMTTMHDFWRVSESTCRIWGYSLQRENYITW